ncbi:M24 family metallopeptidase [Amycolatopsis sp. QT-25]|uniref:M24 family metallopeptidase n=1 Tax=Amycolatopsis sp. QT-25 TaxID=3034022 RepID=UPI0023EB26E4|nr:M24 family metallopeptidase [Amycolatopsis sp. QT-25]WET81028.1 M24 family metallopeptidase [Amycolatopsis sp. QT-25]
MSEVDSPESPMTGEAELKRMRTYRLNRVQQSLREAGCAAAVLNDPVNIRYATDARNMQVWTMHFPSRYLYVPAEGSAILFEYRDADHLSAGLETIGEIRQAVAVNHISGGPEVAERAADWAAELADLLGSQGPLAVDRTSVPELMALREAGVDVRYGQSLMERARMIKSSDEVTCMRKSLAVAEAALAEIAEATAVPGMSENALWAILNRVNAERGGEWIETRLLNSGPRTRPWYQEAGTRVVEAGDLVCLDTDMIGPFGYNADVSRTFLAGDRRRTGTQRTLYALAHEQLEHNAGLLRAGLSFQEFRHRAWTPPEGYHRYSFGYLHGVGMSVEYPQVAPPYEARTPSYNGTFEAGMIICAESYVTADDGTEGVKLENPYLIRQNTGERLTEFPYSEPLSA